MSEQLISIVDATKLYKTPEGGEIKALNNINLQVFHNEFVTLLGPSGCGKTTLLKTISGFEKLDSGNIFIEGESIIETPSYKRPVNTVFQNYALFPHMSVKKNIVYGLEIKKISDEEKNEKLHSVLNLIGLEGYENRMPQQLSGGQQQRVALARAIINEPKILLLDEPLSALDKKLRSSMQIELKNIQNKSGISFIFVTHDQEEALSMSDRIIVMNDGSISQQGSPEEIYYQPKNKFTADFIGETNLLQGKIVKEHGNHKFLSSDIEFEVNDKFNKFVNQDISISIRPEQFFINENFIVNKTNSIKLDATIIQKLFFGSNIKIICKVNNLTLHCLIKVDEKNSNFYKDEKIKLYFDLDKTNLLT